MKKIEVVAAIIKSKENQHKVFATQRGYGEFKDGWEFPGGKVEKGEQLEAALVREIKEELATTITVNEFLCTVEHDYETFHLTMHCYLCNIKSGNLELLEHEASKWISVEELDSVDWLPADIKVLKVLKEKLN